MSGLCMYRPRTGAAHTARAHSTTATRCTLSRPPPRARASAFLGLDTALARTVAHRAVSSSLEEQQQQQHHQQQLLLAVAVVERRAVHQAPRCATKRRREKEAAHRRTAASRHAAMPLRPRARCGDGAATLGAVPRPAAEPACGPQPWCRAVREATSAASVARWRCRR